MAKIVCIDDDRESLVLLKVTLRQFCLEQATSGTAGLALIRETKPDLVLLDLMMPDMDGWQVCKAIKADPVTQNVPVIALSAIPGRAGTLFDHYITKPFLPQELRDLVQKTLQKHGCA